MSTIRYRRNIGLSFSVVVLLLLAACAGGTPTEQVSERPSAEAPAPTDTAAPTATNAAIEQDSVESADAPGGAPDPPAISESPDPGEQGATAGRDYQIVTLLPPEAIPAIDQPRFYTISEADEEYQPDELVLGVELDGEAKAYSISLLSRHEIVNDSLAGRPIAVTW